MMTLQGAKRRSQRAAEPGNIDLGCRTPVTRLPFQQRGGWDTLALDIGRYLGTVS
jgi:hypothetical protein